MKKKIISIPVEIFKREFLSSLYIALKAVNDDYQIIIGEQNQRFFKIIKNGIYFHKDHANWSKSLYKSSIKRNMKTAAFDIEGLIYHNEEIYLKNRVNEWIIDNLDLIFLWGVRQEKLINKVSKNKLNKVVTGSPKFDICNLRAKKNKPPKRLANKILINTRFASTNIKSKDKFFQNLINLGVLKCQKDIDDYNIFIESENLIFDQFHQLIKSLDKKENIKVTIRPHPAEDYEFYEKLSKNFKNVTVDSKTDLYEQILNHDCVIHDGCTTAIEASCMGKPVFGLRPKNLRNAYNNFANNYSFNFDNYIKLYEYLNSTKISNFNISSFEKIGSESIHNWKKSKLSATKKIIQSFNNLDLSYQNIFNPSLFISFDLKIFLFNILKKTNLINKNFKPKRLQKFIDGRKKIEKKFEDIDPFFLKQMILELNDLDPTTSKFDELDIKFLSKKTILIYRKD